ncbi:GNAT family protein [Streptomyces sp. DSM 44917]|uniref:GNAT family protein n=1 Tax=Streptomyces boetiae TaxID=3075541 RepID=A0ABU2LDM4_9ACTN|nr:GNAT family protein [Streptomyces sp. DSM 44917]MDT0309694.1 GNAT family protein [Streptomyces sp. DSM 44917]
MSPAAGGEVPDLATAVPGLVLRELTVKDAAEYFALVEGSRAHLARHGALPEARQADLAWVERHLAEEPGGDLRYGLRLCGRLIGRADLVAVDPPSWGTSWWLGLPHTGNGYATAACSALYAHARAALGAAEVLAGLAHGNDRGAALLQRLGFRPAAAFPTYVRYRLRLDGGPVNDGCAKPCCAG